MRVVLATGPYAGVPGVVEAAHQLARGWSGQAPHDQVLACPLSDGGTGFVEALAHGLDVQPAPLVVTGPDGRQVPAEVLVAELDGRRTAYLEAGQAAGRHLVGEGALADPTALTSRGVGELLRAAVDTGADRIVLGVGDLASHDGGRGMLEALGAGEDLGNLPAVRAGLTGTTLVLAAAVDLPLLGFHGASAALGTDHGVPDPVTQSLEERMGRLTEVVGQLLPPRRDLLSGSRIRPEREAGAGAGGGVGWATLLLGGTHVPGAAFVMQELGLPDLLPGALVVTGVTAYDWQSIRDGVIAEVARAALGYAAPTVVLAERVGVGRREGMSLGISGSYALADGEDLPALAARVARTWSPPPPPPTPTATPGSPAAGPQA